MPSSQTDSIDALHSRHVDLELRAASFACDTRDHERGLAAELRQAQSQLNPQSASFKNLESSPSTQHNAIVGKLHTGVEEARRVQLD